MFVSSAFAGLCLLVSLVEGQNSASSSASAYVQPGVPTGRPIPGDYTGALRPQIHYSPPRGFMVSSLPIPFDAGWAASVVVSRRPAYEKVILFG